jgi:hypothetical protein
MPTELIPISFTVIRKTKNGIAITTFSSKVRADAAIRKMIKGGINPDDISIATEEVHPDVAFFGMEVIADMVRFPGPHGE